MLADVAFPPIPRPGTVISAALLTPPKGEPIATALDIVWLSVYVIGDTGPAVEQQFGAPLKPR